MATDKETLLAVAKTALTNWEIEEPEIELVSISENTVYKVSSRSGELFALRIHRPGYHDLDELKSELHWTTALQEAGVDVPSARLTRDGQGYAIVPLPGTKEERHVGVVEWVEGVNLSNLIADESDDGVLGHIGRVGRIAAQIHNQASAWVPPSGFRRHGFDAEGFMGEAPFWGRFWDNPALTSDERALLCSVRPVIYKVLSRYEKSDDLYSMIHADLHDHNLLVSDQGMTVIDFDDAGFGWHQYELAVALFGFQGRPNFDAIVDALVQGYREVRALSDEALAMLPMFLLIRALALIGWIDQRPEIDRTDFLPQLIRQACDQSRAFLAVQSR